MSYSKIEDHNDFFTLTPTAFLTDSFRRLGLSGWMGGITPITYSQTHIAGRAVTVEYSMKRTPGRTTYSLYEIIRKCGPGDVMVLGSFGTDSWTLGENTVHAALFQELEGLVIDGCVRDFREISEMNIPVFCKGPGIKPPEIERVNFNTTVYCQGTQVTPGDWIVGDEDGVIVIPDTVAGEVIKQAKDIAQWEEKQAELIRNGASLEELRTLLKQKHELKE